MHKIKEQKTNLSKPQVGHLYLNASFEHTSQMGIVYLYRLYLKKKVYEKGRYGDDKKKTFKIVVASEI